MGVLNTEDTSLQENKQYQKRKKSNAPKAVYIYVLIFALIFTFCCLRAVFQMTNSRSVTITINSASVAKGQNPDGTAFDIYQILSDEVLSAASKKLGGKISAAELRQHLSVSDALRAESAIGEGLTFPQLGEGEIVFYSYYSVDNGLGLVNIYPNWWKL